MIIRKVWKNNNNGQLLITIPKDQGICDGDYIKIQKVTNLIQKRDAENEEFKD